MCCRQSTWSYRCWGLGKQPVHYVTWRSHGVLTWGVFIWCWVSWNFVVVKCVHFPCWADLGDQLFKPSRALRVGLGLQHSLTGLFLSREPQWGKWITCAFQWHFCTWFCALPYKWSSWLFDGLSPLVMYKSVVSLSVLNAWDIKLTILSGLSYLGQLSEETCTVCVLFS